MGGFQEVPTPYYDNVSKSYVMIPVERMVRFKVIGVSNAYVLVFFACCREVKKPSETEIKKLALEQSTKTENLKPS